MEFDPGQVGIKGNIFGFPWTEEEAELILLPIPWEATVSYQEGTADGPKAILEASPQLDFSIAGLDSPWNFKAFMTLSDDEIIDLSSLARQRAIKVIDALESGKEVSSADLAYVNDATGQMVERIRVVSKDWLRKGKVVGAVGGDHSTPLGLMIALSEHQQFGILQIDAHMDLREAYEGFHHSHASIMYNALELKGVESITQVGIRDFCEEELERARDSVKPVHTFFDDQVKSGYFEGKLWGKWVDDIIATLPDNVYISFDIDGLDPALCPNTGTPVPGGLSFEEADYLMRRVADSGKQIIGFDLSEVGPSGKEWDANVASRVLYRLCAYTGLSK